MFASPYLRDFVTVQNGHCNGRSSYQELTQGRVTITGKDREGKEFCRVVEVRDSEIVDNILRAGGKVVHRVRYGEFESRLSSAGREVTRFHKASAKGRHGKSNRYEKLFGHDGCCHSWYKRGRLVRQKFYYDNGVLAYDWDTSSKPVVIRNVNGSERFRVTGDIDGSKRWTGDSVFNREMEDWFRRSTPFSVEERGKVIFSGQYEHGQRVGKWVLPLRILGAYEGLEHYYVHGVAIPKKLYDTPAEKLNPRKLLKISNAQLRMAMLAKANFTAERLSEIGTVVHKHKAMRLFDVKGLDTRILRVQCPSTKSFYFIHVPKDSTKCEEARQWTFHVNAGVAAPIKFDQET